jgi:phosphoglucosamine mutase
MIDRVRITVSGIRGQVPDALNADTVSEFASAFATFLEKGTIAFCRDSRSSSPMLSMAAFSAVIAAGLCGEDFGCLPTPFLQFHMKQESFRGGIVLTGGHNPEPWNAVLLLSEEGNYLEMTEGMEVFNIHEASIFQKAPWNKLGTVKRTHFPFDQYCRRLAEVARIEAIRDRRFKIVADPCGGAVAPYLKDYAEFLNLDLTVINDRIDQPFPHPPEPNQANASQAEAVVRAVGADLGFQTNSDGSRLSLVDEKGKGMSAEMTFPLCLLSGQRHIKKAVTTLSTSSLSGWAAKQSGISLIQTKVGQSAVIATMGGEGAQAGGEGSGSFSLADFSLGYDALLSLALILEKLAVDEQSLSAAVSNFPHFFRRKINREVPAEKLYRMMDMLEENYRKENPDFTDGIRVDRKDVWFHIRPSMTEFTLRIIIEGTSRVEVSRIEDELNERMGR